MNGSTTCSGVTTYPPRYVTSADGTRIWAAAAGTRPSSSTKSSENSSADVTSSVALVLIPGFAMVWESFETMFQDKGWLKRAFLVAYDTRGHGRSDKPLNNEAWESKRIAEDFEAVCREFEIKETFVLGWSLGSAHFTDILGNNTHDRIKILGFINIGGGPYLDPTLIPRYSTPLSSGMLAQLLNPPSVDTFCEIVLALPLHCSPALKPDLYRKLVEGHLMMPRGVVLPLATRQQPAEAYRRVGQEGKIGLLVVLGIDDTMISATGLKGVLEEVGWAPKKFLVNMMPNTDHMPWISSPNEFRDIVLGWMKDQMP